MRTKIRQSVFETNSSSVHSLSFPKGECKETLKPKNGVVKIPCGDFSGTGIVWGLHEKLSYLCTYAVLDYPCDVRENGISSSEDNWDLDNILDALKRKYPDLKELVATKCNKACFDHQTHPCSEPCVVHLWDTESLETFLFNDDIKINMGRD